MSKRDNLSLLLYGRYDLRLEQTPLPGQPKCDEVQLATHTVGICGSDLHFYVHANCDTWTVKDPIIMGHESSATVVAIGSDVTNLKVGDRVAIEPGVSCHSCDFCTDGRYNLCRKVVFQSCPPYHGSLRRLYNHKAYLCYKLPDNVSFGEGAIIEPLAVAVYGSQKLNLGKNQNEKVLVIGAGPVGLLTAAVAKAYGVRDLCILDTNQSRLELATILGIPNILRINKEDSTQNVVQSIKEIFGDLPDITMECTGVEACLNIAIGGTKEGGRVGLVGLNNTKVNVSLSNAGFNELELIGVRRYRDNCFSEAIDMVSSGQIDIKPLISHVFRLEEGMKAFETALKCEKGVIKWCTAFGFNALDDEYYGLFENKTIRSLKPEKRSQYVYRIKVITNYVTKEFEYIDDKQWGKRPVLEFLGICPKDEVMPEDGDEDEWISDTVLFYMLGALVIFAFVLPILILWKLEGRYRLTQEIYDDSRLGSQSATRSATHSSEDGPADLTGVRKVRLSQMKINV